MLKIKLVSHNGYEGEYLAKLNESLALLENIVNGQQFKDRVINFKSDRTEGGTFHFIKYTNWNGKRINLTRYSNQEIYDKIMKGNESNGTDTFIVFKLKLQSGSGGITVGYTDQFGNIHTYMNAFLKMSVAEFAAHLFHEYTHTTQFSHSETIRFDNLRNCYSVPYALGNFIEIIATGSCRYRCKY